MEIVRCMENIAVYGNIGVYGNIAVYGNVAEYGNIAVYGNVAEYGNIAVYGNVAVYENVAMYGNIAVYGIDYTLRCARIHLFSIFTSKTSHALNLEDTDKNTLLPNNKGGRKYAICFLYLPPSTTTILQSLNNTTIPVINNCLAFVSTLNFLAGLVRSVIL